ncbi:hypothetical protein HED55_26845 [Ochrobactrum haematophilum]|uniref:Uncharacterized protein n=1 Tax=Brucella haematophila TaxID=419474 RepID=A0ABX1DSG9_9HYPH|nr:hypothetical protein [Brucella haematophila]
MAKETRRESPVVRSEFSSELGVDAKGVKAFVTGIGKSVYQVHFPFLMESLPTVIPINRQSGHTLSSQRVRLQMKPTLTLM